MPKPSATQRFTDVPIDRYISIVEDENGNKTLDVCNSSKPPRLRGTRRTLAPIVGLVGPVLRMSLTSQTA